MNNRWLQTVRARMPEWSKGADLRSAGESRVGSNPTPCIYVAYSKLIIINATCKRPLCSVSSVGQSVRLLTARSLVRNQYGAFIE